MRSVQLVAGYDGVGGGDSCHEGLRGVADDGWRELAIGRNEGAGAVNCDGPYRVTAGHLPGALNVPLADLPVWAGELGARRQPIIQVCKTDRRSARAATELLLPGYEMFPFCAVGQTGESTRAGAGIGGGNGIVSADMTLEAFGKELLLLPVLAFDEARHASLPIVPEILPDRPVSTQPRW